MPHFAGETLNEGDSVRLEAGQELAMRPQGERVKRPEEGRLLPTETKAGTENKEEGMCLRSEGMSVMVVANDRRPAGAVMRAASLTNWSLGTDKGAGAPQRSMGSASSSHRAQEVLLPIVRRLAILLLERRQWRGHIREKSSTLLTKFSSNQKPEDVQ